MKKDEIVYSVWINRIIELASLIVCVIGVITSIRMNLVGRSLWYDEAALAFSFSQRGLLDLTSSELELIQSAPVAWLYLVKIFTLIFGNTDFVLRVPAIIAYVLIMIFVAKIMREVFDSKYPITASAFAATLPLILQYSNVFKPYIFDGLCGLIVVYCFFRFEEGKMTVPKLSAIFMILIWFSNPASFVEGSVIIVSGIGALLKKDWKKVKELVIITVLILASFVADYFYWLRQTATSGSMQGFWADWKFPLFIKNKGDFVQMVKMLYTIFAPFYRLRYVVAGILLVTLIYALVRRNTKMLGIFLSFFVAAFASALSMFPVNKRLWLFFYPLAIVLVFAGTEKILGEVFERVSGENKARANAFRIVITGLALFLLMKVNSGIRYYWNEENVYWPGYEAKAEYQYLLSVVEPTDGVYIYNSAAPMFDYYNGYNFETLGETEIPIMVGNVALAEGWDCEDDLDYIFSHDTCYVFMSDSWDVPTSAGKLFTEAEKYGTLERVYFEYETPLFLFTKDK